MDIISVRPILRIGEYSLIALQYQRIRYIGLRVSTDTDTPAAITINSDRTRRLKHMVRVDRMWLQMRPAFLFTFRRTDCRCDTSRHQRHSAASTAGKEQRYRVWSGACSAADHAKLESFISRCKMWIILQQWSANIQWSYWWSWWYSFQSNHG